MQLFLPVSQEQGLNILRAKLRPDLVKPDLSGNITCFTKRQAACKKSGEYFNRDNKEIFLIVIDTDDQNIQADLEHKRPIFQTPLAKFVNQDQGLIALTKAAQRALSEVANFSLEIVPATADLYNSQLYRPSPSRTTQSDAGENMGILG